MIRRPSPASLHRLRLALAALLTVAVITVAWGTLVATDARAFQDASDDQTEVEFDADNAELDTDAVGSEASNLPALLIGAVLLGAGVWAYMNKKKRFPGARFRD